MQKHKSEKRSTIRRHEEEQRTGERDLAHKSDHSVERPAPGKGKPDPEEGVGTVQNQKR
jgi:hypothetical protein